MLSCKHSLNQIFNSAFSLHCSGTMAFPSLESHWAVTIGFLNSWFGLVKFHHVSTWEEHLSESKWFVLSYEISIPEVCMFINHIYKTNRKVVQSYTFCYLHVMKLVWKNVDVQASQRAQTKSENDLSLKLLIYYFLRLVQMYKCSTHRSSNTLILPDVCISNLFFDSSKYTDTRRFNSYFWETHWFRFNRFQFNKNLLATKISNLILDE